MTRELKDGQIFNISEKEFAKIQFLKSPNYYRINYYEIDNDTPHWWGSYGSPNLEDIKRELSEVLSTH
jgi:hypothetical protein